MAAGSTGTRWQRRRAPPAYLPDNQTDLVRCLFVSGLSTSPTVTDVSGRGVGLAALWESVDQLRGTIDVVSSPGAGTRFVVRIPVGAQLDKSVTAS